MSIVCHNKGRMGMANILIVEDEFSVSENICEILSTEDHNCIQAYNGVEALQLLDSQQVDLIVSDVMMPQMDGVTLYKKIVREEKFLQIPFIFLTAKSEESDCRKMMNLGASDYIKKPFKMHDLIEAVNVRLKKSKLELDRVEEIKRNISKYIPHELRTPIGIILGYSNLIIEDQDDLEKEEILSMVKLIEKSGLRLKDRIEKLILLTEIELDIDSKEYHNLNTNIEENILSKLCMKPICYYNRKKDFHYYAESAVLKISDYYLEVLLCELIDNACKFSNPGQKIILSGQLKDKYYKIIIADNGIGMDMDEVTKLSSFVQFERELNQQEGNGLGISIIKRIMHLVEGNISIKSTKGVATIVELNIPLVELNNKKEIYS